MTEDFLQYVWKHQLEDHAHRRLADGQPIEIIDRGVHNADSGPDFFNAKIKIGETLWAGNVELHLKSSQWYRHNHHLDKAYDSVILHVVADHDREVLDASGVPVPVYVMKIPESVIGNYTALTSNATWPACNQHIRQLDATKTGFWLGRMGVERLQSKTETVNKLFVQHQGSWEAVWLQLLASAMGFRVNKEPFVLLMQRTPFKVILKESHSLFRLEALLFGQAGLLDDASDEYSHKLRQEYAFLQQKHDIKPMPGYLWKFARMRPGNFPTLRLAQFAALIHKHPAMVSVLLQIDNTAALRRFFDAGVSDYWHTHYRFGAESKPSAKKLSDETVNLLLINVVAPFVFFYGKYHDDEGICTRVTEWLADTAPENNYITRRWSECGMEAENALASQALLHLREHYCLRYRCVHCYVGSEVIR